MKLIGLNILTGEIIEIDLEPAQLLSIEDLDNEPCDCEHCRAEREQQAHAE